MKRPAWVFLPGLAAGILLAQEIALDLNICLVACLISAGLFLMDTTRRAGLFACAFFLAFLRVQPLPEPDKMSAHAYRVVVTDAGSGRDFQTLVVKGLDQGEKIRLTSEDRGFQVGDVLSFRAEVEKPTPALNPYAFDQARYLAARGLDGKAYVRQGQVQLLGRSEDAWLKFKRGFQTYVAQTFDRALVPQHSDLMQSLILGASTVDVETSEAFRTLGLTHLLAISGLQVQIIAGLCVALLLALGLHCYLAQVATLAILVIYAGLIGFPFSIMRAVLAFAIGTAALLLGKSTDDLNALAMSAVIILIGAPYALFDIGFQLSMAATAALIILTKYMPSPFLTKSLSDAWQETLAVQLGLFPLQMRYFNHWNPLMIIMNLALVPLFGLFTTGAFAILLTGWLPWIPEGLGLVLDGLVGLSLYLVKTYASVEALNLVLPSLSWPGIACLYLLLAIWLNRALIGHLPQRIQGRVMAFALVYLALFSLATRICPIHRMTFIAIGQGDSFLFQSGKTRFLFDTGGSPMPEETKSGRILEHFLTAQGIRYLDGIWLSHPDADHVGNLDLARQVAQVGTVYASPLTLQELKLNGGIPIRTGDLYRGRGFEIRVVHSDDQAASPNDRSAVLLVKMGQTSILLTGDIEGEGEAAVSALGLEADFLKVPHHGSGSSSSEVFLDGLRPKIAIVSVGPNRYGHPDPEVLARYQDRHIDVLRTDRDGAICLSSSVFGTWVKTQVHPRTNLVKWMQARLDQLLAMLLILLMMIRFWKPGRRQDELQTIDAEDRKQGPFGNGPDLW